MGGAIRVITIVNNTIHRQDRWTNSQPNFVHNPLFFERDPAYIYRYLTSNDDPSDTSFSPDGYGLDVFDFDNKRIYTCQGYCRYGSVTGTSVFLMLSSYDLQDRLKCIAHLDVMLTKGYLGIQRVVDPNKHVFFPDNLELVEPCPYPVFSLTELVELMDKTNHSNAKKLSKSRYPLYADFKCLWEANGWELHEYREDLKGAKQMLADLKQHYPLSEKDEADWVEWFERMGEDDDED